jgi:hypothetical protein
MIMTNYFFLMCLCKLSIRLAKLLFADENRLSVLFDKNFSLILIIPFFILILS